MQVFLRDMMRIVWCSRHVLVCDVNFFEWILWFSYEKRFIVDFLIIVFLEYYYSIWHGLISLTNRTQFIFILFLVNQIAILILWIKRERKPQSFIVSDLRCFLFVNNRKHFFSFYIFEFTQSTCAWVNGSVFSLVRVWAAEECSSPLFSPPNSSPLLFCYSFFLEKAFLFIL